MAVSGLSAPREVFGIHNFTAVNKTTDVPYGTIKVIGSANLTHTGDLVELMGGSNPNAVAVERGVITNEIGVSVKEYNPFLHTLAGADVTDNSAEAGGFAGSFAGVSGTITNRVGTSLVAATGIASVGVKSGSETDLKDGTYLVVAASATTVDVYQVTDFAFRNGTDEAFENDNLKITASALTVVTATATEIPAFGIEFTGGAGTIALVTGDSAVFTVRSINDKSSIISYGENPTPVEFEGHFYSQRSINGNYLVLRAPRCVFVDFPVNFAEQEFSTTDLTIKMLFDTTECITHQFIDTRGAAIS